MLVLKGHTDWVRALAYSPDGRILASAGDDHTVRLWDPTTGQAVAVLTGHEQPIQCVAFAPNGEWLATAGYDRDVLIWDVDNRRFVSHSESRTQGAINSLTFSPDGKWLAVGNEGRYGAYPTLSLYCLVTGGGRPTSHLGRSPSVWSTAFSPDSEMLAVGFASGAVDLMPMPHLVAQRTLTLTSGPFALAFSPDGQTLAALPGRRVQLWDVSSGKERMTLARHEGSVWSLAFTPDGRYLATGAWDSTVRLWDPATGQERARYDFGLGRVHAVAFAPDGMTAAAAGTSSDVVIWDVEV